MCEWITELLYRRELCCTIPNMLQLISHRAAGSQVPELSSDTSLDAYWPEAGLEVEQSGHKQFTLGCMGFNCLTWWINLYTKCLHLVTSWRQINSFFGLKMTENLRAGEGRVFLYAFWLLARKMCMASLKNARIECLGEPFGNTLNRIPTCYQQTSSVAANRTFWYIGFIRGLMSKSS